MPRRTKTGRTPGRICVTLPISVACDLTKFQRALANVTQCLHNNGDLTGGLGMYPRPREFVVDAASLQVREERGT